MAALGFAFLFLALSVHLLLSLAPSEQVLDLSEGLLFFAAPSELAHEAVAPSKVTRGADAPSELLPDVVWGCSDFLLVTALLLIFGLTIESNFFPRRSFLALLETLMFSHMNSWTA